MLNNLNEILNKKQIIHISGIGGIGMSAIAIHLKASGYNVQGSDPKLNARIENLQKININVFTEQAEKNLHNVTILIKSSAINDSNPEILYAKKNNIIILSRAEILNFLISNKQSIAVTGAHGKTSTTAMMSNLLLHAKQDPSFIVGGILNNLSTNAHIGKSNLFVTEADESDGTINFLTPTYSIVTNIDHEHMDFYKTFDNVKSNFKNFISKTSKLSFVYGDQKELYEITKNLPNVIHYGESENSHIKLLKYKISSDGSVFDFSINNKIYRNYKIQGIGKHHILNALPVVGCAQNIGISDEIIREGIYNHSGVKRRFTKIKNNLGITIIDDYAHHPNEIKAVFETAKYSTQGKIFAVIQVHRYSRFQSLFDEFCAIAPLADYSFFTKIYSAGEQPTRGLSNFDLISNVKKNGFEKIDAASDIIDLTKKIAPKISKGDLILFLGAGDITKWANDFPLLLQNEIKN